MISRVETAKYVLCDSCGSDGWEQIVTVTVGVAAPMVLLRLCPWCIKTELLPTLGRF